MMSNKHIERQFVLQAAYYSEQRESGPPAKMQRRCAANVAAAVLRMRRLRSDIFEQVQENAAERAG